MQSQKLAEQTNDEEQLPVVPHQTGIVGLADTIEKIKGHFDTFEKLKSDLLNDNDYYEVKLKDGKKGKAIGKSGWYKFGVAFNISTFIIKEEKEWLDKENQIFAYHLTVQASAPNGRTVQDVGSCSNAKNDREGESEHVVRAMATTRAKERCYITMVGAPEKASEDERVAPNGNSVVCVCSDEKRDVTADKKGCRNCKKQLSPESIKNLK